MKIKKVFIKIPSQYFHEPKWITSDNQEFSDENEAIKHERFIQLKKLISKFNLNCDDDVANMIILNKTEIDKILDLNCEIGE